MIVLILKTLKGLGLGYGRRGMGGCRASCRPKVEVEQWELDPFLGGIMPSPKFIINPFKLFNQGGCTRSLPSFKNTSKASAFE